MNAIAVGFLLVAGWGPPVGWRCVTPHHELTAITSESKFNIDLTARWHFPLFQRGFHSINSFSCRRRR